jgi:hypothetical protein
MKLTSIYLEEDAIARAERLVPFVRGLTAETGAPTGKVARSAVLRLAILRGLAALEEEARREGGGDGSKGA